MATPKVTAQSAQKRVQSQTSDGGMGTSGGDHARHVERLNIAEKLSRARPDLVAPSYAKKRARLLAKKVELEVKEQCLAGIRSVSHSRGHANLDGVGNLGVVDGTLKCGERARPEAIGEDDDEVDWERSRRLAGIVQVEVRNGRRASKVLPRIIV